MNKEHFVYSLLFDEKGGIIEADFQESSSGTLWFHIDSQNEESVEWLYKKSGLEEITCKALLNSDSRPRVTITPKGILATLRGINLNPGSDPEDMIFLHLWIEEKRIISIRQHKVKAVENVYNSLKSGIGPKNVAGFIVSILIELTKGIGEIVNEIYDEVDDLEDEVIITKSADLRLRISDVRREIIMLRRYIMPQRDVILRLQIEDIPWIKAEDKNYLREIGEITARYIDDLDSSRERAGVTQEELNNLINENMNRTIYFLSIISTIFLPLTFMTGLLGINVGGIPGAKSEAAFWVVLLISILLGLIEYLIFKRSKKL